MAAVVLGGCAQAADGGDPTGVRSWVPELLALVDERLGTGGPRPAIDLDGADPALRESGLAAVTVAGTAGGPARLVIDTDAIAAAPDDAARALIAHELVHVRLQPLTSAATPLWAVEGYADLVAFDVLGLDPVEPMTAAAAAGGVPSALPDDAAFAGTGESRDAAYAQAWLWWRTLQQLCAVDPRPVYEAAADGDLSDLDTTLQAFAGVSAHQLTAAWIEQLGQPA